jgi:hypothetical protein
MRSLLLCLFLLPLVAPAQNGQRLQRALAYGNERALDRWMKSEVHRVRKGHQVTTPSGSYTVHDPSHDSLVAFLRRQTGVEDAAWDRCIGKLDIWPGHSTIGLRLMLRGVEHERCYHVQEGIPGTINFFGWRPHLRKDREQLKYLGAADRPGFVAEQRRYCAERQR